MPLANTDRTVTVLHKDNEYCEGIMKQDGIRNFDELLHKMVVSYKRSHKIKKELTHEERLRNAEINEIMGLFAVHNPSMNFGHGGHRKACDSMLRLAHAEGKTFKDLSNFITYLLDRQEEEFVPEVTTPTEFWNKWLKCKKFIAKQRANN